MRRGVTTRIVREREISGGRGEKARKGQWDELKGWGRRRRGPEEEEEEFSILSSPLKSQKHPHPREAQHALLPPPQSPSTQLQYDRSTSSISASLVCQSSRPTPFHARLRISPLRLRHHTPPTRPVSQRRNHASKYISGITGNLEYHSLPRRRSERTIVKFERRACECRTALLPQSTSSLPPPSLPQRPTRFLSIEKRVREGRRRV